MPSSEASEAEAYARYLMGPSLPPGPLPPAVRRIVERYRQAEPKAAAAPDRRGDHAVVGFVGRHPWSLPLLDAASGLVRRHGLLRRRLLLMTALLEASPVFVAEFLPRPSSPLRLALRLAALGLTAAARAAVGLLLYPIARLHRP